MAAPADADLVLEIDLRRESPGGETVMRPDPDLGLRILDAKTHFVLWECRDGAGGIGTAGYEAQSLGKGADEAG